MISTQEKRREHFQRPEIIANPIHVLLRKTTDGRSILRFYLKNGRLKKNLRNLLTRLIVDPEKDRQLAGLFDQVDQVERFKITKEQFITWSEDIKKLFPAESKYVYYKPYQSVPVKVVQPGGGIAIKKRKLNTRGTLFEHYDYLLRKLREQDLLVAPRRREETEEPRNEATEEERHAADWLATHVGPPDTVRVFWRNARLIRQELLQNNISVSDYFLRFPVLKSALGADLLSADFRVLYPDAGQDFQDRWNVGKDVIINALAECSKLKGEDSGYYKALPALAQHNKDSVILYLLPYLVSPPRSRNQAGRLTILEKQEAFLIHAATPADIEGALQRQRQICVTTGTTLQPIPVIVGPIVNPEGFYVYVNDSVENPTIYQAPTVLEAVALTVRIVFALNCSYTTRAQALWVFIQKTFFNIEIPTDHCSREVTALIATISQQFTGVNENIAPNGV